MYGVLPLYSQPQIFHRQLGLDQHVTPSAGLATGLATDSDPVGSKLGPLAGL